MIQSHEHDIEYLKRELH
jgi:hypothetical protein